MSVRFITRIATLAIAVTMPFACSDDTTTPIPSGGVIPADTGTVTLEWQKQSRDLVAANRLNALSGGRVYAAVSVAQFWAARDADAQHKNGRAGFEMRRGAVAGASARVLGSLFPTSAAALDQIVVDQGNEGSGQTHPMFTQGVEVGRAAADLVLQHLKTDGFTAPWTDTVPKGPGMWIPTALPPGGGVMGKVKPYFLTSGSQFRPTPPPTFGSAAFNQDLNEVLTLTQNITAEQTALAKHWDAAVGTPNPIGLWNSIAAGYVAQKNLDERAATQVFAMMHASVFDALIGCWDAKYHYWMLRPSQANSAITLVVPLPNFPAYPSGHSCASSSAGRVLRHYFPDRAAELASLVSDAGFARIVAGIHYRFDVTAGQALGTAVAELALAKGM
jgi:hypothetical protein